MLRRFSKWLVSINLSVHVFSNERSRKGYMRRSKEVTEKVTESIEVGADVDMEDATVAKVCCAHLVDH